MIQIENTQRAAPNLMECRPFQYTQHFRAGVLVLLVLIIIGILLTRRRAACGTWNHDDYGARDQSSDSRISYRDVVHLDA